MYRPWAHSGPAPAVVRAIFSLTMKDSRDRVYYRTSAAPGQWMRLRKWCYERFNRELDRYR